METARASEKTLAIFSARRQTRVRKAQGVKLGGLNAKGIQKPGWKQAKARLVVSVHVRLALALLLLSFITRSCFICFSLPLTLL